MKPEKRIHKELALFALAGVFLILASSVILADPDDPRWFGDEPETDVPNRIPGIIKGRLVDEDTSVPIISYFLRWVKSGTRSGELVRNGNFNSTQGHFLLDDLTSGRLYDIFICVPGYPTRRAPQILALPTTSATELILTIPKGTITRGIVYDTVTSEPISGAEVSLDFQEPGHGAPFYVFASEGFVTTHTTKDGAFALPENGCRLDVSVSAWGYSELRISESHRRQYGSAHDLRLGLYRLCGVEGTITWKGRRVRNAVVFFRNGRFYHRQEVTADSDGHYSMDELSHGVSEIEFSDKRNNPSVTVKQSVDLAPGEKRTLNIDLCASGTSSLEGRITVAGKPPSSIGFEARVMLIGQSEGMRLEARTDSQGRYRFEDLPEGQYSVCPSANGSGRWCRDADTQLKISGAERRDFDLKLPTRASGRIFFDSLPKDWPVPDLAYIYLVPINGEAPGRPIGMGDGIKDAGSLPFAAEMSAQGEYELIMFPFFPDTIEYYYRHASAFKLDTLQRDQNLGVIHLKPADEGVLRGTVKDRDGRPLSRARVFLERKSPPRNRFERTTAGNNEHGEFALYGLPLDQYIVRIERDAPRGMLHGFYSQTTITLQGACRRDFIMDESK